MANMSEILSSVPEEETPISFRVPSYLLGADNHTIGKNAGASWFDPSTWGTGVENIGRFAAVSMLSGANSFYNTGAAVGRLIGAETEQNDTGKWITSLDQDLGKYYKANEQYADLAGFIVSSVIPGLGGIKALNIGQSALRKAAADGIVGSNLSRATGLLVPRTALYIEQSSREIAQGMGAFSAINTAGVKALASGVHKNVLEGLAFEIAVQATLQKSPILDSQDVGDIAFNLALGGALGGVIGGAFTGAVTYGTIKRAGVLEQERLTGLFGRKTAPFEPGIAPSNKVILLQDELDNLRNPISNVSPEGPIFPDANPLAAAKIHEDKVRRIQNEQRIAINEMAVSPGTIGNQFADALHGTPTQNTLESLLHVEQIGRLDDVTAVERDLLKAAKGETVEGASGLGSRYVKITGEGAGQVVDEYPLVHNLADRVDVPKGSSVEAAVLAEVKTFKHKVEDGFSLLARKAKTSKKFHLEVEARYIAMDQLKELPKEAFSIHFTDLPVLERAYKDGRISDIRLLGTNGKILQEGFASTADMQKYIIKTKDTIADKLTLYYDKHITDLKEFTSTQIAKIVNTKLGRLQQTRMGPEEKDYFARQTFNEEYTAAQKAKGLLSAGADTVQTEFLPSYAKVSYRVPPDVALSGHVMNGLAYINAQAKVLNQQALNVVAKNAGEFAELIPVITPKDLAGTNTFGAGAGPLAFANAAYKSLGAKMQLSGALTEGLTRKLQKEVADTFESTLSALARNPAAAIERMTVNQKMTRSGKLWLPLEEDSALLGGNSPRGLITRDTYKLLVQDAKKSAEFGDPIIFNDLAENSFIAVTHKETWDQLLAEQGISRKNTVAFSEVNAVRGHATEKDLDVIRPIRPNLQEYQHFAFVKDARVTGSGHTTMLHAASPQKLDELIASVRAKGPQYTTITKRQSDDWFEAQGEYEYSRSLNENYINSDLANKGIFSEFYTKTDPQKIVNDILNQYLRDSKVLATELVRLKNEAAFNWLEDAAKSISDVSGSTFSGTSLTRLEREGKNPILDYVKTGLNISKVSEYPLIYNFNKTLDKAVSNGVAKIRDLWAATRTPVDLEAINTELAALGMNTAFANAAEIVLANHTAPKGELTKFVRSANAILSTLTLGLDPINALNNSIGANILRTTELKQITDAIAKGDTALAGQLAELVKTVVPGTGGDLVLSPSKLMAKAMQAFAKEPKDSELMQYFRDLGVLKGPTEQFRSILDDFTLQGTETVSNLNSRRHRAFEKAKSFRETGQKYSGNELSEEFNRFVSAYSMKQITDLAEKAGLLTRAEAGVYINTFVNRVEGNIIASQRPLIFQGPIGQAIGLFQSYQFNLMQQMFRYVSEGSAKDAGMLLGLQGTFYGLAGLPAFQFINQHVLGNLSGNVNHRDAYDAVIGIAGEQAGKFIMYGAPSNILQMNLYTRGDVNPRQLSVLPTSLSEVPFIGAYTKFFGSVKESVTKIAGGAPVWESLLQGIEHNGLSRPLSGMAQTLQATGPEGLVYSTTGQGSILYSNDLFSWATATRLAGARPLNEAVVNEGVYRIQSYKQMNSDKMTRLAEVVKNSVIAGNQPSENAISGFAAAYAEAGGKQPEFNQWFMKQFKAANTPESLKISQQLSNPLSQKMQLLLD